MESEGTPDHIFSSPETNETSKDREINDLPERLGFIETAELSLLKAAAIEAHLENQQEQAEELRSHYQLVGEQLVNQLQGEAYTAAQIGFIVALGNLRRASGKVEAYVHDLDDAIMYASNMGYDEVVPVLETAKSQTETT
jgi:hypothetical protein